MKAVGGLDDIRELPDLEAKRGVGEGLDHGVVSELAKRAGTLRCARFVGVFGDQFCEIFTGAGALESLFRPAARLGLAAGHGSRCRLGPDVLDK